MSEIIDFILHVDSYLLELTQNYGAWIYAILFVVVFAETGLVVTPFLPGDSLLFATGALAATGALDVRVATVLVVVAAIAGDAVNYSIGRSAGAGIIHLAKTDPRWGRWIDPAYVARAHEFFERHGGKAIVLGRFMPIVRTFVPFVAGVAEMSYPAFALYNITGGHRLGRHLHRRRVSLRQRPHRQGELLAGGDRHRHRLGAADGHRIHPLPPWPARLAVRGGILASHRDGRGASVARGDD